MPYIRKGKCVYRRDTGKKVGCSSSIRKAKQYLKALHVNVKESYSQLETLRLIREWCQKYK